MENRKYFIIILILMIILLILHLYLIRTLQKGAKDVQAAINDFSILGNL